MTDNNKGKCGIYVRVSTLGQADKGTSLANQEALGRAKAQEIGREVARVYSDAGVSGALFQSRADLQDALRDLQSKRIDTLIVANLSRFSRDVEHQAKIRKDVQRSGGRLVFCDFDYMDTPEGDLQFDVQGAVNAYERKIIDRRTKDGKRRRATGDTVKGLEPAQPMRSLHPYGYRIFTTTDSIMGRCVPSQVGQYKIMPAEAAIIIRMYSEYAAGASLQNIADGLNADAVPVPLPGIKRRRVDGWVNTSISTMLSHPVYKGEARYGYWKTFVDENRLAQGKRARYSVPSPENAVTIPAPPLVSTELWDAVQVRKGENKKRLAGGNVRRHLLSGLVQCQFCGHWCIADSGGATEKERAETGRGFYPHFQCRGGKPYSAKRNNYAVCCRTKFDMARLDTMTLAALEWVVTHPDYLRAAIRQEQQVQAAQRAAQGPDTAAVLEKEAAELKQVERALIEQEARAIARGIHSEVFQEQLAEVNARRKKIAGQLAELKASSVMYVDVEQEATLIYNALLLSRSVLSDERLDKAERNRILRGIVARVIPLGGDEPGVKAKRISAQARAKGAARPDECWVQLRDVYQEGAPGRGVSVSSVLIRVTVDPLHGYQFTLSLTLPLLPFEGGTL